MREETPLYPRDDSSQEIGRAMAEYITHPGFIRYLASNIFGTPEPDTPLKEWRPTNRSILTLPGWAGNARSMGSLNRALKEETCNIINGVDIGFNLQTPITETAEETFRKITNTLGLNPSDIDILGYSQGGLTALALQKHALEESSSFQSITTLGTPFLGTPLVKGGLGADMNPQSKAIEELILSKWNPQIPVHIIKTRKDHISPESQDALDHLPGEAFDTTDHWKHLRSEHAKKTASIILELIERGEFKDF